MGEEKYYCPICGNPLKPKIHMNPKFFKSPFPKGKKEALECQKQILQDIIIQLYYLPQIRLSEEERNPIIKELNKLNKED